MALESTVWCGPPHGEPRLGGGAEVGAGLPDGAGDRQVGQRLVRLDDVDLVGDQPEPVTHVGHADDDRRAGGGVEDQADRVLAAADAERVDLAGRGAGGDRGADLQHVRAEDQLPPGLQVVGVVLHEGGAAGQAQRDRLEGAQQDGGLPVALAAEAVAVRHQALDGEAGQLAQAAEVLEVGGEGAEAALGEEAAQAEFDPGGVPQGVVALPSGAQPGVEAVGVLVLLDQLGDVGVGGGVDDGVDDGDEVVDAVGVDGDAEAELGLDLVALGDGDVAHVVAEAGELEGGEFGASGGGAGPGADAAGDGGVGGVVEATVLRATPRRDWM